jgi:pimeloyl-ACP methyl ester carboxylesterase
MLKNRVEGDETLTSGRRTRPVCKNGGGLSVNGAKQNADFYISAFRFILANLQHETAGCCNARIISIVCPGQRKGTFYEVSNFLSHNTDRWALHFLQRGWAERRADTSPAARFAVFFANVRASLHPSFRSYHLVAPDYPGFGHSDRSDSKKFAYTFDHIAEIMNHFTEALGLSHFTLYMQDYRGPVGFRMILAHPDRVEALIVQDAVAHNTGLGENWKTRRVFWADRATNESALRTNLLSLATTKARHAGNDPNVERHDPDLWTDEFYFINQPGQGDIQSDLFYDYRTNVDSYPKWQAWMREKQPRLLVIWGKYESSFHPSEPESYRHDVPKAEVHIVDGGHFALDTAADEIAALVQGFVGSSRQGLAAQQDKTRLSEV